MLASANSSPGQVASCSPGSWVPLFLQRQESKIASYRHSIADLGQRLLYPDSWGPELGPLSLSSKTWMTWSGRGIGDIWSCGIQVSWRQDTSEDQEPKPGPRGGCVEIREAGAGVLSWQAGSRKLQAREMVTAKRSHKDSKGGKLRMVCVDFWSLSCSSAPPSPLCTHGLGLHLHLRPGTGCWVSSLGPEAQTAQMLGQQHG